MYLYARECAINTFNRFFLLLKCDYNGNFSREKKNYKFKFIYSFNTCGPQK